MQAIERHTVSQDWITLVLLGALVLLVAARYAYTQKFAHFVMLFATDKYLLLQGKKAKIFHPFNILLFLVNIISVGLFIYIFYLSIISSIPERPKILFIRITTAYAALVLLKFSLEKIVANILSMDKEMDHYLFYKLSYRNFMSLVLLPVCVTFIYVWSPSLTTLFICIALLLFFNFVVLAGFYRKNQQYILSHWFYFILYLCALEIGPYFILYKLITKW